MLLLFLAGTAILFLVVGFLLGRFDRKPAVNPEEIAFLRQQTREFLRDLEHTKEELDRAKELSAKIPGLVRRLSGNLPKGAIPGIAVRFLQDFFRSSCSGFFVPVDPGNEFTLVEGVGFPDGWKGSIRIPADQGMLGMAMRYNTVISRKEYLGMLGKQEIGSSPLERSVGIADLIAPVPAATGILGAIVITGCPDDTNEERTYLSMIADMLGSALQRASVMQSAEIEASVDSLTGLSNRRHFAAWFETELRQANNYSKPLSLLLFDIDHFKKINDTYGHPAGDQILKTLATTVRGITRSSNLVARYGGEEFAVVMTSSNREQALSYAESVRRTIESLLIRIPGQTDPVRITISGGIASYPADGGTTSDLIRTADDALYTAKQEGRNRICSVRRQGLDGQPI